MNIKKYYIITTLMALIISPLAVSIGLFGISLIFPPILALVLVWFAYTKKTPLPENALSLFLPIIFSFCYYMMVWIVTFGLSNYHFDSDLFSGIYLILTLPYFVVNFFFVFAGNFSLFPIVNAAITIITILTILITCAIAKKKISFDKKIIAYSFACMFLCGIAVFQHYDRNTKVLPRDYQAERIEDEVNLNDYHPFDERSELKRLEEPATITFNENYPKLDGATAAYPVYGAIAQELYKGLDKETVEQYVACTKTSEAYTRLISGEIDIFFGAQPSKQQVQAAQENGVEFVLTPIGKEAFVFFVSKDNSVNNLTVEQIQDIYQKKITNWNEVGGTNETIMPFQRPENSGSQTIMLASVMGDKPLPAPLWEEYAAGMVGIISQVAAYRNYSSAIGYSFRYFATGMKPNSNIKLLAINGIEPTAENIKNASYPFTVDVYAVTAGSENENTEKLIQWILSEQGQKFIETCGYTGN